MSRHREEVFHLEGLITDIIEERLNLFDYNLLDHIVRELGIRKLYNTLYDNLDDLRNLDNVYDENY